jgi:hypothetical protein
MALSRASGLFRLALRTQWAAARLLSAAAGGELGSGEDRPGRRVDLDALRRERALRSPSERSEPAPARRVFRTPKPSLEQMQLNQELQACASGEAVLALVTPRFAQLSVVNITTALMTLSRRASRSAAGVRLQGDARFAQLLSVAESLFPLMEARGLSNTLYACGQLRVSPPAGWLQRFWEASGPRLGEFKALELSISLYACSQLGVTPPSDWLPRFWLACALKMGEFKPQELSNMLYACGQLDVTPPGDWLQHLWAESGSRLSEFDSQNLANMVHGCGQLRIKPPADWLLRVWAASASKLRTFKPQELSMMLLACASLGIRPPNDWMQHFSAACEQSLADKSMQNLSNLVLALAMLQLWDLPLWRGLWERLCSSLPRDNAGWSAEDELGARQLYQAYQAAAVERPGLLPAPSPELLAAARASRIASINELVRRTRLHDDVSACLTQMGVAHTNELWCARSDRRVDIAIDGTPPTAVEVDGPTHYLQQGGGPTGASLFRNRMLEANGWRVVVVDHHTWDGPKTQQQREELLRRVLAL